jgi:hypothetical protein
MFPNKEPIAWDGKRAAQIVSLSIKHPKTTNIII